VIGVVRSSQRQVTLPTHAPAEALLRRRGFTPGLSALAHAHRLRGYDVLHAFTPIEAVAAQRHAPTVFTCSEVLDRTNVADRRLRLWSLERALRRSAAVTAADAAIAASLARWFALDVPVVDDYRELYGQL
jgi:hypothetical protein